MTEPMAERTSNNPLAISTHYHLYLGRETVVKLTMEVAITEPATVTVDDHFIVSTTHRVLQIQNINAVALTTCTSLETSLQSVLHIVY